MLTSSSDVETANSFFQNMGHLLERRIYLDEDSATEASHVFSDTAEVLRYSLKRE